MFKKIYVPVDNSEYSNKAIEMALALATPWNATIVGSHVYAAKMHDYRFKQMEYTLPEEYQDETELAHAQQRQPEVEVEDVVLAERAAEEARAACHSAPERLAGAGVQVDVVAVAVRARVEDRHVALEPELAFGTREPVGVDPELARHVDDPCRAHRSRQVASIRPESCSASRG